jgi:hypothetical protein
MYGEKVKNSLNSVNSGNYINVEDLIKESEN